MLKPAISYQGAINIELTNRWHDPKYQYYNICRELYDASTSADYKHEFVSVNFDNKILGFIMFETPSNCLSAMDWEMVSFIETTDYNSFLIWTSDILDAINLAFIFENRIRIEFRCTDGNPVIRSYRKFIKRFGGIELRLRQYIKIRDELHDEYLFEIMRDEFNFDEFNKLRDKLKHMIERLNIKDIIEDE